MRYKYNNVSKYIIFQNNVFQNNYLVSQNNDIIFQNNNLESYFVIQQLF